MSTILLLASWRFFFSAGTNESIHIHCEKGEAKAKYWLHPEHFDITEVNSGGMSPADKREVRKIIFDHFDYLVAEWNSFQGSGLSGSH